MTRFGEHDQKEASGEQKKIQDRIDKKVAEKKELEEKWLQEAAEKRRAYTDFLNGIRLLNTATLFRGWPYRRIYLGLPGPGWHLQPGLR